MPEFQNINRIFEITSEQDFNVLALEIFSFQYENNALYRRFCDALKRDPVSVRTIQQIPFLPIEFFKQETIISGNFTAEVVFESSGTTGMEVSKHHIKDLSLYEKSFMEGFQRFYGDPKDYCILALLPSYLERDGSSLVYMVKELVARSKHPQSGFFLHNHKELFEQLQYEEGKVMLIGVSFALLDFVEKFRVEKKNLVVMETGGMKGRRREITREELHQDIRKGFPAGEVHSEYGMTELLSQAYMKQDGIFQTPPWMKVLIREMNDPMGYIKTSKSGVINVVDLANVHSCSFIATQDVGRYKGIGFEVLGRTDVSDIRGCNLMVFGD